MKVLRDVGRMLSHSLFNYEPLDKKAFFMTAQIPVAS